MTLFLHLILSLLHTHIIMYVQELKHSHCVLTICIPLRCASCCIGYTVSTYIHMHVHSYLILCVVRRSRPGHSMAALRLRLQSNT